MSNKKLDNVYSQRRPPMKTLQTVLHHELTVPTMILGAWVGASVYLYQATHLVASL